MVTLTFFMVPLYAQDYHRAGELKPVAGSTGPQDGAGADRSPGEPLATVTWADVVYLVNNHPAMEGAASREHQAQAEVETAGQLPNPTIGAEVGRGRLTGSGDEGGNHLVWSGEVELPISPFFTMGHRKSAARAEVRERQAELELTRRDLLLNLRNLYLTIAHDQLQMENLEATEEQMTRLTELVKLRVETGEARPIESLLIEAELEQVKLDLDEARSKARLNRDFLALLLNRYGRGTGGFTGELRVQEDLTALPPTPEAGGGRTGEHPLVQVEQAAIERGEHTLKAERLSRIPQVEVGAFLENEPDLAVAGGLLKVEIPIGNRNQGTIKAAQAQIQESRTNLESTKLALEQELMESRQGMEAAYQVVHRYRDEILPRLEQVVATMEITYQLGECNLLDLIGARQNLLSNSRAYHEAMLQLQQEHARWQSITGQLD